MYVYINIYIYIYISPRVGCEKSAHPEEYGGQHQERSADAQAPHPHLGNEARPGGAFHCPQDRRA